MTTYPLPARQRLAGSALRQCREGAGCGLRANAMPGDEVRPACPASLVTGQPGRYER